MSHAKLSASGSARWLACPGSVAANADIPNTSSSFAEEGTLAHELADLCLKNVSDADVYIGKSLDINLSIDTNITADMAQYVQEYLDYVRAFEGPNTLSMTEMRVEFSKWVPGGFGTLDSAVLDGNTCHIFDLKYGQGVAVDAFENTQGQLYALGMLSAFDFLEDIERFVIHIVQPRKRNFSHWEISTKDLLKFGDFVEERAALALSKDAARVPGEKQCQWCGVKDKCKPLATFVSQVITAEFDDMEDMDINTLSDAETKAILDNQKLIETFVKAVEASVFSKLESGEEFDGYKLVEGRSIRKWDSEAEGLMMSELGEDAYNKKLIGITEANKLMGKDFVNEHTVKPTGKPTLAKASDKRTALDTTDIFEKI